jgi:hypothetical protein
MVEQIEAACRNIGYDSSCGACAEMFFTGSNCHEHDASCKTSMALRSPAQEGVGWSDVVENLKDANRRLARVEAYTGHWSTPWVGANQPDWYECACCGAKAGTPHRLPCPLVGWRPRHIPSSETKDCRTTCEYFPDECGGAHVGPCPHYKGRKPSSEEVK